MICQVQIIKKTRGKKKNKKKKGRYRVYGGQSTRCSASHRWVTRLIKNDNKKRRFQIFCTGMESPETKMYKDRRKIMGPIFRWAPKGGHAPDLNPCRQKQRTNTLEQKENSRSVSALSFSSWHVSFCPANAVDSTFFNSNYKECLIAKHNQNIVAMFERDIVRNRLCSLDN